MSVVGDSIRRATEAGRRAAQIAPFVHARPSLRPAIRKWLLQDDGSQAARDLALEFEARWRLVDAGLPAWKELP